VRDVDHTSGVHDEVGRVHDPALGDPIGIVGSGQLIVGRPGDGFTSELRDRFCVQRRSERTRGEDVASNRVDLRRLDRGNAVCIACSLDRFGVHVGDGDEAAVLHEVFDEVGPDLADALDGDVASRERVLSPQSSAQGSHRVEDAPRRRVGRVTRAAAFDRDARHVWRFLTDDVHVRFGRPDVLGSDVAAAE
jgi:hypothetical protein